MRLLMRRLSLVCASAAACAIFQSDWRLEPSPIGTDRATLPAVQIPDTVTAGVPETVVVWTKGGGCTRRAVPQVASDDLLVTIRLFDSIVVRMRSREQASGRSRLTGERTVLRWSGAQNVTRAASPEDPRAPNHGPTLTRDCAAGSPGVASRTIPSTRDTAPTPASQRANIPRPPAFPA